MAVGTLVKKASFSLAGHMALAEIGIGFPCTLLAFWLDYERGSFSPLRALWISVVCAIAAVVWAFLFWFTVSKALIAKAQQGKLIRRQR